jgi:hypothetical protein
VAVYAIAGLGVIAKQVTIVVYRVTDALLGEEKLTSVEKDTLINALISIVGGEAVRGRREHQVQWVVPGRALHPHGQERLGVKMELLCPTIMVFPSAELDLVV